MILNNIEDLPKHEFIRLLMFYLSYNIYLVRVVSD